MAHSHSAIDAVCMRSLACVRVASITLQCLVSEGSRLTRTVAAGARASLCPQRPAGGELETAKGEVPIEALCTWADDAPPA